LAAGTLLYNFSFQNELPRPRDWDLFAIAGPGFTMWGLYVWLRSKTEDGTRRAVLGRASLFPALAFAVAVTVSWIGVNHHYVLLSPEPGYRALYVRYRVVDLMDLLPVATVAPSDLFCSDPAQDPTGCRRVTRTEFTMPQNGDTRPVIFAHAPARIAFPLDVPRQPSFLWTSPALDPLAWGWGGDGVTFRVRVQDSNRDVVLWERHLVPSNPADRGWVEAFVPLNGYAGRRVNLILETDPGPAGNADADRAGWGVPWLLRGTLETADADY
jgi:hypothetical protein